MENNLIARVRKAESDRAILLEALEGAVNFYVSKVTSWRMGEACANGFPLPENIDWPPFVVTAHEAIVKTKGQL